MAFNMSVAREKTATAVIDYGDRGNINLVFYPDKYTPDHEDLVDRVRKNPDAGNADVFIAMMLPLIADWDITHTVKVFNKTSKGEQTDQYTEVEEKLPITADSIRGMPYHILGDLMGGINKALLPGEQKTTDSGGSFA